MTDTEKILGLSGLQADKVTEGKDNDGIDSVFVDCRQKKRCRCTACGSLNSHVNAKKVRTVRDLDIAGKRLYLNITVHQYQCQEVIPGKKKQICGKTFWDKPEMIREKAQVTIRFEKELVSSALDTSFQKVADKYGVSDMTVKRALDRYFEEKEKWREDHLYCPIGIGIDENHIAGQYCLVIVDLDQHRLLDMYRDKDPETVRSVLEKLKEKERLQYVTMDLSSEYRACVREVFGQKISIIADHYHVQNLFMAAMLDTKKKLEEQLGAEMKRDISFNINKLRKNLEDLTDTDKEEMSRMFKAMPGLDTAYALKEAFRSIYNYKNRSAAEKAFERFCKEIPEDSAFEVFRKKAKTIRQWHKEVFNYFDYDGASNGFTEAENGLISRRNVIGNGYSFEILRDLALYGKGNTAFHPCKEYENTDIAKQIITEDRKWK